MLCIESVKGRGGSSSGKCSERLQCQPQHSNFHFGGQEAKTSEFEFRREAIRPPKGLSTHVDL